MSNAVVTIKTVQHMDGETFDTEFISQGSYEYSDAEKTIKYSEKSPETGLDVTNAIIRVYSDEVFLSRTGESSSEMYFKVGEFSTTEYATLYGTFDMTLMSNKLDVNLDENGGNVEIEYVLSMDKMSFIKNNLSLSVKVMEG